MTLDDLLALSDPEFAGLWRQLLQAMGEKQRKKVASIALELHALGAQAPLAAALSEVGEDIAQRARFSLLREFRALATDVPRNLDAAADFADDMDVAWQDLCAALGEERATALLRAYGCGLLNLGLDILDDGNAGSKTVGWAVVETDAKGKPTGRRVESLHEDWLDFEGVAGSETARNRP